MKTTDGLTFHYREDTSDIKAMTEACGRINNNSQSAYYRSHKAPIFKVNKGDVWLDLGAHIGSFTCRALKDGATKVVAVEAFSENFSLLERNVAANGFIGKTELLHACIGSSASPATLILNITKSTYRHTVLAPTTKKTGHTENVPRITLMEILRDNPEINAVKMDIEGSERDVLLNSNVWCSNIEKMVFEYSFDHFPVKANFQQLCASLRKSGFDVYYKPSLDNAPDPWDKRVTRGNNGALVWCTRHVERVSRIRTFTQKDAGYFYGMHSTVEYDVRISDHTFSQNIENGGWQIVEGNAKFVDVASGEPVIMLLKGALAHDEVKTMMNAVIGVAKGSANHNRGVAGGRIDLERIRSHGRPGLQVGKVNDFSLYPLSKSGSISKTHFGNPTDSAIIGWTDTSPRNSNNARPTKRRRLTKWTEDHMDQYEKAWPCLQKVSDMFRVCYPERWKKQMVVAMEADARIGNTAFSTVTVNWRFRSALHTDKGDYKEGMGCIFMQSTDGGGGELLFPEYGLAVRMETGDILFFNPHIWHCTAPFSDDNERASFVCYFREKLSK